MTLFSPDREATQLIAELSEQSVGVLPSQEEAEYDQWLFEICKLDPTARQTLSPFALLDAFLASLNLGRWCETHGSNLREVDREEARKILRYILSQNLAYSMSTDLKESCVEAVIEHLFHLFSAQPLYLTNGTFTSSPFFRLSSWRPMTDHTFDTGLLFLDEQRVGILWATDED
jgi:hypothetical protein